MKRHVLGSPDDHEPTVWLRLSAAEEAKHAKPIWRRMCLGCPVWMQCTDHDPADPKHPDADQVR